MIHLCWSGLNFLLCSIFFVYKAKIENGNECFAPDDPKAEYPVDKDYPNAIDVAWNFEVLLTLYAFIFLIDGIKELLKAIYYKTMNRNISIVIMVLRLNYIVWIVTFILTWYFRTAKSGWICSHAEDRLRYRGFLLLFTLYIEWLVMMFVFCIGFLAYFTTGYKEPFLDCNRYCL